MTLKILPERRETFANLQDIFLGNIAQEAAGFGQIGDLGRVNLHQPGRSGIHSHQIVPKDQHTTRLRVALDRAVAFHTDNAIDNGKLRHRQGTVDVRMLAGSPAQCRMFLGQP